MMVLRDLGFTSCQVYSGIIFDLGLLILCHVVFMAACFFSENPIFIVGPNSIVTGSHTGHMTVDLGELI